MGPQPLRGSDSEPRRHPHFLNPRRLSLLSLLVVFFFCGLVNGGGGEDGGDLSVGVFWGLVNGEGARGHPYHPMGGYLYFLPVGGVYVLLLVALYFARFSTSLPFHCFT